MFGIIISAFFLAAVVLQFTAGDFPVNFFAFPLNLIVLLLWLALVFWSYRDARESFFVKAMLSPKTTVAAISLLVAASLAAGLWNADFVHSWIFVSVLFFFMTVLLYVILRGWRCFGRVRICFILNHIGLLTAVAAGFFGAPDREDLRMPVFSEWATAEAYIKDGGREYLPYEIMLTDFHAEYHDNGVPSVYRAQLLVNDEPVTLEVNHPHKLSLTEDLYLASYEQAVGTMPEHVVLQIVRDPWKFLTVMGIIMMLLGALMLFVKGPAAKTKVEDVE